MYCRVCDVDCFGCGDEALIDIEVEAKVEGNDIQRQEEGRRRGREERGETSGGGEIER